MQFQMFPSRDKPFCGFPNPVLVPVRTRNYVRLCGIVFRRDKHTANWWAVQNHSAAFELTDKEVARIPTFMRHADMETYVERLVAFEAPPQGAPSPGEGTHGADPDKTN